MQTLLGFDDDTFAAWRATHVQFLFQADSDPSALAATIGALNPGEGSIFLIGHSAGASTIVNYLKDLMRNPAAPRPRIASAIAIDAPIGDEGPAQGLAGFWAGFAQKSPLQGQVDGLPGRSTGVWLNNLYGLGAWGKQNGVKVLTVSYDGDYFNPKHQVADIPFYLATGPRHAVDNMQGRHNYLMWGGAPTVFNYATSNNWLW